MLKNLRVIFGLGGLLTCYCAHAGLPNSMAISEVKIWKAYYKKDLTKIRDSVGEFLQAQYKVVPTHHLIDLYLKAVIAFSSIPQEDPMKVYVKKVLPLLKDAFTEIEKASVLSFDPEAYAKSELKWWVARRNQDTEEPELIGELMQESYGILYGKNPGDFARISYLRATAARYRDMCQDFYGGMTETDWKIVQDLLESAYKCMPKA